MIKVNLEYDRADYIQLPLEPPIFPRLNERYIGVLLAVVTLMNNRDAWVEMQDFQWDNWENQLARIQEELMEATP